MSQCVLWVEFRLKKVFCFYFNLCCDLVIIQIYGNTNAHTCGRLHLAHTCGSTFVCGCTNLGMFVVPRRIGLVCVHSSGCPHVHFHHTEGPVCGHLAVRPHVSFHSRTGAGVWAFISSPTRPSPLPHPKLSVVMCFCRAHGNCPSVLVSR